MKKISLNEITTLNSIFDAAKEWDSLPVGELSNQQIALLSLRNSIDQAGGLKAGGLPQKESMCFICATGA